VLLPAEGASFGQPSSSSGGLAEDSGATSAHNNRLSVAEYGCDLVAPGALHIHEVGVGVLDQALQLMFPLFLMGLGVEQISGERHLLSCRSWPPHCQ